ncbi:MAG: hypothetical protein ABW060_18790 [Solirubrobacteraceae bacterium]
MRIRDLFRAVASTLLLLALAGAPASAAVPAGMGPEGRVFTLVGGDELPREGLPAHKLRVQGALVRGMWPAALPGGEIALVAGRPRQPWLVGMDGRLHALPALRGVTRLAAAQDGTLLAVQHERTIHRLAPRAAAWDLLLDPRRVVADWGPDWEVEGLATLPGGGYAFWSPDTSIWRVDPGGAPVEIPLAEGDPVTAVAGLPSGDLVVAIDDERLDLIARDGGIRRFAPGTMAFGLAALPDGDVLRAGVTLDLLGAGGGRLARIGRGPGLGPGDGGPARRARLLAYSVAAAPDGTVVASEFGDKGFDRIAVRMRDGSVIDVPLLTDGFTAGLRVFAPPATARPLAAVARGTYRSLPRGRVTVRSTFAGHATVVVRRAGREIARAEADVPAGRSTIALAAAPPAADLTVSLEVTGAGGRAAGGRLEVSALPRLTRRAALALAGVIEESFGGVADCRRTGRRRFVCEQPLRDPVTGNCTALIEITQRADGRTAIMDPESCA